MGDIMRPVPFGNLVDRIFSEYRQSETIFGLHKDQFFYPNPEHSIEVFGQECATPLGPAAGPHTQLAQNIVASYLMGGRFIELKTVQILDTLEIEKPCIYAQDEAYNIEWSTEYTLPKALDEYIKAYFLLSLLDKLMFDVDPTKPSFIFNMSVGYNFEGIKSAKMQTFINSMIDASKSTSFNEIADELESLIKEGSFLEGTEWEDKIDSLKGLTSQIDPKICKSVTLSTMHGCPSDEIEAICAYMLKEKKIHTFVKLNPTLLGYDKVRSTLDSLGFDYVTLKQESFDNDLQYPVAIKMLERLLALAKELNLGFGVKLTNTLGTVNDQGNLPQDEMYMSGRSLLPLTCLVGSALLKDVKQSFPISYSGGASGPTILELFETGIRPITLATDLLKPGGYIRLKELATILEEQSNSWSVKEVDEAKLTKLATENLDKEYLQKEFRGDDEVKVSGALPLSDCYIAPCVQACPIHQNVPDYIHLVGQGRYSEALDVIYETNALPNLTGYICDHQCQFACTRLDYEGTVQIREMKKIAAEQGFSEYVKTWEKVEPVDVKAAVIGSGPAGLSAAYFLARSAFDVTVFEKEKDAGGITRNVIPQFRFPVSALQADIDFIAQHGVKFNFGVDTEKLDVESLKKQGFKYIFYAIGAEIDNVLELKGPQEKVRHSLPFLTQFREDPKSLDLGERVVIVGGGNTAMDSARAAIRVDGVKEVSVVYRRSEKEMPADREEYGNAKTDGVTFHFLTQPKELDANGNIKCVKMVLGELDSSGRRRPIESDDFITLKVDTLITAIGESVDKVQLNKYKIPINEKGWAIIDEHSLESEVENVYVIGDAVTGPSTVVRCIASANQAVEAAIDKELASYENEYPHDDDHHHDDELDLVEEPFDDQLEFLENQFFASIREKKGTYIPKAPLTSSIEVFAQTEAKRCLECNYICDKCVEVCPNRANVTIDMRHRDDIFANPFQIVHLDAFCNECGNCETFCPWEGAPYKDKLTLFNRVDDFESSKNSGFYVDEDGAVVVRLKGEIKECRVNSDGSLEGIKSDEVASIIEEILTNHTYLLTEVGE
ncbi:MAG: putative selenate reductase subunit YgfK [Sphaerochaetaceae bacterium]